MAEAHFHARYAVAMMRLLHYRQGQKEDFLTLNTECIEILNEETECASKGDFFSLPEKMHEEWSNRKAANLAKAHCIHHNIEWVEENIEKVKKLQHRSDHAAQLDALLTDDEVKERVGNL